MDFTQPSLYGGRKSDLFPVPHTKDEFNTNPALRPLRTLPAEIPEWMKALPQWICWRSIWRSGQRAKVPFYFTDKRILLTPSEIEGSDDPIFTWKGQYQPAGVYPAKSNDIATWMEYETAVLYGIEPAGRPYRGGKQLDLGLELSPADLLVDWDKCRNPATGEIDDFVLRWLREFQAYTDVSPSGTGVKQFLRGVVKPGPECKSVDGRVEMFVGIGRYGAVTGRPLDFGTGIPLADQQRLVDKLYAETLWHPVFHRTTPTGGTKETTGTDRASATIRVFNPGESRRYAGHSPGILDVSSWLNDHGVGHYVAPGDSKGRTVYVLDACPFNPRHRSPDSSIMQDPVSGALSANCFHNSCGGNHWQEFKRQIGAPEAKHYLHNGLHGGADEFSEFADVQFDTFNDEQVEQDEHDEHGGQPLPLTDEQIEATTASDASAFALTCVPTTAERLAAQEAALKAEIIRQRDACTPFCPHANCREFEQYDAFGVKLIMEFPCNSRACPICKHAIFAKWAGTINVRFDQNDFGNDVDGGPSGCLFTALVPFTLWESVRKSISRAGGDYFRHPSADHLARYLVVTNRSPATDLVAFSPILRGEASAVLLDNLRDLSPSIRGHRLRASTAWKPPSDARKSPQGFKQVGEKQGRAFDRDAYQEVASHHGTTYREGQIDKTIHRRYQRQIFMKPCHIWSEDQNEAFWKDVRAGKVWSEANYDASDYEEEEPTEDVVTVEPADVRPLTVADVFPYDTTFY